jgi:hypothetical protein
MTYASELIQQYRQALHYLWNMHFWAPEPFREYASVRQFDRVKLPLFLSLVVDRLGSDLEDPKQIFGSAFKVVPPVTRARSTIPSLMIERPQAKGVWELINGPFSGEQIKLSLIDFFDWQLLGWRDFRYYLVKIDEFHPDPSLRDCKALVEVGDVDVLWEPPGILGLPQQRRRQNDADNEK